MCVFVRSDSTRNSRLFKDTCPTRHLRARARITLRVMVSHVNLSFNHAPRYFPIWELSTSEIETEHPRVLIRRASCPRSFSYPHKVTKRNQRDCWTTRDNTCEATLQGIQGIRGKASMRQDEHVSETMCRESRKDLTEWSNTITIDTIEMMQWGTGNHMKQSDQ